MCSAIPGRRDAEPALERTREMALVDEAGLDRQARERHVGADQPGRRPLDPQPACTLADALVVVRPKGAGEVRRMNADLAGDVGQSRQLPEALVQEIVGFPDPAP